MAGDAIQRSGGGVFADGSGRDVVWGSLMTRNIARRGFDMRLAAGYQVWGGLLTPIVLPVVVWMAGLLHGLTIWIPPRHVLTQIAGNQFVPLVLGLALARWLPSFSTKALP